MAPKRNQAEAFSRGSAPRPESMFSSPGLVRAASRAQGSTTQLASPTLNTGHDQDLSWRDDNHNGQASMNQEYGALNYSSLSPYGSHSNESYPGFSHYQSSSAENDMSDFDDLLNLDGPSGRGTPADSQRPQDIPSYRPTNTVAPSDLERQPTASGAAHLLSPAITSTPSPRIPPTGMQAPHPSRGIRSSPQDPNEALAQYSNQTLGSRSTDMLLNGHDGRWAASSPVTSSPRPNKTIGGIVSPHTGPTSSPAPPVGGQGPTQAREVRSPVKASSLAESQGLEEPPARQGIDPGERAPLNEAEIPSIEEQTKKRQVAEANKSVETWLTGTTDKAPKHAPAKHTPTTSFSSSREASTGLNSVSDIQGHLVEEDEQDDSDEDEEWDSRTSVSDDSPPTPRGSHDHVLQTMAEASNRADDPACLSAPFRTMNIWSDSPQDDDSASVKHAPKSSTQAIERFEKRAKEVDNVSLAATYASSTRRSSTLTTDSRVSTTGTSQYRKPSYLPEETAIPEESLEHAPRKDSILNTMKRRISKPKTWGRKESHGTEKRPSLDSKESTGHDSQGSIPTIKKSPSWDHRANAKSVQHDSSSRPGLGPNTAASFNLPPKKPFPFSIKRQRSKSDLEPRRNSALAQQWAESGGPPVAFVVPSSEDELAPAASGAHLQPPQRLEIPRLETLDVSDAGHEVDEDEDEATTPTTGTAGQPKTINVPESATLEGFRDHARKISPKLAPFLLERIAHEQIKRYRHLVDLRIEHHKHVINDTCSSAQRCADLGTGPKYTMPQRARGDKEEKSAIFQISADTSIHEIEHLGPDETPQLATFPEGIPQPPVKQLPAEFECPICFKIKRLNKPSDWSKHCFEDLYPFICSFADCGESKSFNRKADWSRHESERHLKLETWTCSFSECSHVCHRRDNFIQHLVRAHKMAESKAGSNRRRTAEDDSDVSRLAQRDHSETKKSPTEQKCPFCGCFCNAWKKLAVHLANHMKQINLPLLALIEKENIAQYIQPVGGEGVDTRALLQWRRQASLAQNYPPPMGTPMTFNGSNYTGSMSPQAQIPPPELNTYGNGVVVNDNGQYFVHPALQGGPHTFPGTKNLPRQPPPSVNTGYQNTSFNNGSMGHNGFDLASIEESRDGQRTPTPGSYPPQQYPYANSNGHLNLNTDQQFLPDTTTYDQEALYTSPVYANGVNDMAFDHGMSNGLPNHSQYYQPQMTNNNNNTTTDPGFMPQQSQAARNAQLNAQLLAQQNASQQYRTNRMNQTTVYYDANEYENNEYLQLDHSNSAPQFATNGMGYQQAMPGGQQPFPNYGQGYQ